MSIVQIDARGRNCPEPVLMTKKAAASGANEIETLVDSPSARENVSLFLSKNGFKVEIGQPGQGGAVAVRGFKEPA